MSAHFGRIWHTSKDLIFESANIRYSLFKDNKPKLITLKYEYKLGQELEDVRILNSK